jgi:hypothetical protein
MKFSLLNICVVLLVVACQKEESPDDSSIQLQFNTQDLERSLAFENGQNRGFLKNSKIDEASGLAASRSNTAILWVHNDKGNPNYLYAVGKQQGTDYGFVQIEGSINRDWEDMCIGPGPIDGVDYLYIGDIGDNDGVYPNIIVYRFPEPDIRNLDSVTKQITPPSAVESMVFIYPDGPKDAESLMIDPFTKDLFIISKRGPQSILYTAPYPQATEGTTILTKVATFPFNRALAADISQDGTEIAIKTDHHIYYWKRNPSQSVLEALKQKPLLLPYTYYPQGEGFCWDSAEDGYFTVSENHLDLPFPMYFYGRK